ncbi:hypothetical protein A0J61_10905, partial [Choanephora cucurbitarum]
MLHNVFSVFKALFRDNSIQIVLNGYLSPTMVLRQRRFKQGGPISCILYNFALEPLLRSLLQDDQYQGYSFVQEYGRQFALPCIKFLSYA